jgi:lysophospholipase L1-like esterase
MWRKTSLLFHSLFFAVFTVIGAAQTHASDSCPKGVGIVGIESSYDGTVQKARFYPTNKTEKQPLVVSLHTWSGNYDQEDPIVGEAIEKNWNYIHPDFRGPNNRAEACGSPAVIADIDDAIDYAIENGNVDLDQIHIIGASGGGHATLLMYMKSKHNIRSFSAWVPISNLVDWYYEVKVREKEHAEQIAFLTSGDKKQLDVGEAKRRSPIFMDTPIEKREFSKLNIYCGVHDGYKGAVPISQSIDFYNKVVSDFDPENIGAKISDELRTHLLLKRNYAGWGIEKRLGKTKLVYQKSFNNKVTISVFDGAHEMLPAVALNHVPSKTIMALGDSNGAFAFGWPQQLQALRPNDMVLNYSISGNTIGFDNQDKAVLNTLKNIESYFEQATNFSSQIDAVVIMLGTNDCKTDFDRELKNVPENYKKLIRYIKSQNFTHGETPEIIVVSPPPYGDDAILDDEYHGANKKVLWLNKEFKKMVRTENCKFLDVHSAILPVFDHITSDGIHLRPEGQVIVARMIDKILTNIQKL